MNTREKNKECQIVTLSVTIHLSLSLTKPSNLFQMSFECRNLSDEDLEFLSQPSGKDSDYVPSHSSPPDSIGSSPGPDSSQVTITDYN